MKKTLVLILTFMVSLISLGTVNAKEIYKSKEQENSVALNEMIESEKIDIEYELVDTINEYSELMKGASNSDEKEKLTDLIEGVTTLLEEYRSNKKLRANPPNSAVVAVIAYFNNKGYNLSKELLVHATLNSNKYSTYKPVNGSVVKSSSVFRNIALGTSTSGSSRFPNTGGVEEKDCYYSIHKFSYRKSSSSTRSVTIKDYYDFAKGDYSGLAGIAVNAMYYAQQNGSIVPYNVEILSSYNPNYQSIILE